MSIKTLTALTCHREDLNLKWDPELRLFRWMPHCVPTSVMFVDLEDPELVTPVVPGKRYYLESGNYLSIMGSNSCDNLFKITLYGTPIQWSVENDLAPGVATSLFQKNLFMANFRGVCVLGQNETFLRFELAK